MKTIAVIAKKGGVGKTTIAHLLAVGGILEGKATAFIHTDDRAPLERCIRPYKYYDCRSSDQLIEQMGKLLSIDKQGLIVIDSGGNRPKHDKWIGENVDFVIIPLNLSGEDIKLAKSHAEMLEEAGIESRFLINKKNVDTRFSEYDQELVDRLPQDKIMGYVRQIAPSKRLLDDDPEEGLKRLNSDVAKVARQLYRDLTKVVKI